MKQIIFGAVITLLLSGFFVEQAFAQINGANGGKGEDATKGGVDGNGGIGTSGKTINGNNGTSANGHGIGGTINSGD
ncbi:MAG: lipoprotein [Candidatus Nitrosopolaris sp.]